MIRVFFLDRDGVINKNAPEHDYIKSIADLELLPDISESISLIKKFGYKVIVISNQQGVGRKIMSAEDVNAINNEINLRLKTKGTLVDTFYWCGHLTNDNCECRKPKPGLLQKAIKDHDIDVTQSFFIGDRESDKLAGDAAGVKTILVPQDSSILQTVQELLKK